MSCFIRPLNLFYRRQYKKRTIFTSYIIEHYFRRLTLNNFLKNERDWFCWLCQIISTALKYQIIQRNLFRKGWFQNQWTHHFFFVKRAMTWVSDLTKDRWNTVQTRTNVNASLSNNWGLCDSMLFCVKYFTLSTVRPTDKLQKANCSLALIFLFWTKNNKISIISSIKRWHNLKKRPHVVYKFQRSSFTQWRVKSKLIKSQCRFGPFPSFRIAVTWLTAIKFLLLDGFIDPHVVPKL